MGLDSNVKFALIITVLLGGLLYYRMGHPHTVLAADGMDAKWDSVAAMSKMTGEPTVVLFTADWCGACQWLHGNVLNRSDVQEELREHYNFCTIDLTNPQENVQRHAAKLGVHGIPCLIRYDAAGNETSRENGMSSQGMIAWLKAGE